MVILTLQASVRDDELYNGMAPGVKRIYFTGVSIWDSATTDISCECKDGFFNSPVVAGSGGPGQGDCIPWQECDAATQVTDFAGSKTRNRDCKCRAGYSRATLAVSLSRLDHCTACSAGAYQHSTGQTSCDPCAAGTYQPDAGQTSCDSAGIGYKVGAEGATLPTACAGWHVPKPERADLVHIVSGSIFCRRLRQRPVPALGLSVTATL